MKTLQINAFSCQFTNCSISLASCIANYYLLTLKNGFLRKSKVGPSCINAAFKPCFIHLFISCKSLWGTCMQMSCICLFCASKAWVTSVRRPLVSSVSEQRTLSAGSAVIQECKQKSRSQHGRFLQVVGNPGCFYLQLEFGFSDLYLLWHHPVGSKHIQIIWVREEPWQHVSTMAMIKTEPFWALQGPLLEGCDKATDKKQYLLLIRF